VFLTVGVIVAGFFRAQILEHGRYELQAQTNRLRPITLPAARGVITDRTGQVLADNVPGYTVALLPGPQGTLEETLGDLRARLVRIAPIVKLDSAAIERVLVRWRRAPYLPALVLGDASFGVVSALEERRLLIPGLVIQTEPKRYYPDSSVAAHLLGSVGEVTEEELTQRREAGGTFRVGVLIGKTGLERQYDDSLRGFDGVRFVEVSALGHVVREAGAAPTLRPVAGTVLRTALDLDLQRFIARIFPAGQRGAIMALNPNTGEVLALYSAPGFDPNAFVRGATPEYFRRLNESEAHPFLDRAIQARYPPGSIWKLAIAAMALKRGIVTMRTRMPIPCRGGLQYGNRFFRCWQSQGHGDLTLQEAIAQSCDVYFYQLGLKLGLTTLLEDANAWGFRGRTGIDLPGEIQPEFPSGTEYYDQRYGVRRWTSAVTLNLAIGQGENDQTLISLMRLYQMLASDGQARTPYLVRPRAEPSLSLELSTEQLVALRLAMQNVVERGTGRGARIGSITIAGKTATAQNPHGPDHGWFVAFAPADKPQIVVGAIIEFARHGSSVAPLVARVIARYLGVDTTEASLLRFELPADSAPPELDLLPAPLPSPDSTRRDSTHRDTMPADTVHKDTLRVQPPPRNR
jgi:penicillin-binding protein 2